LIQPDPQLTQKEFRHFTELVIPALDVRNAEGELF
jgi:hypothetical protein